MEAVSSFGLPNTAVDAIRLQLSLLKERTERTIHDDTAQQADVCERYVALCRSERDKALMRSDVGAAITWEKKRTEYDTKAALYRAMLAAIRT